MRAIKALSSCGIGRLSSTQNSVAARGALNNIKPGRIESPAGKAVKDAAAEVYYCYSIYTLHRIVQLSKADGQSTTRVALNQSHRS